MHVCLYASNAIMHIRTREYMHICIHACMHICILARHHHDHHRQVSAKKVIPTCDDVELLSLSLGGEKTSFKSAHLGVRAFIFPIPGHINIYRQSPVRGCAGQGGAWSASYAKEHKGQPEGKDRSKRPEQRQERQRERARKKREGREREREREKRSPATPRRQNQRERPAR